jgi:hypothetical protein
MTETNPADPFIRDLRNRLDTAYRETDKLLVSVSTGVLALSVAFASSAQKVLCFTSAIKASWVLFFVTILLVLISLLVEQRDKEARISSGGYAHPKAKKLTCWLKWLNKAALTAFGLACIALLAFLFMNI